MITSKSSNCNIESAVEIARRVLSDCSEDNDIRPAAVLTSDEILAMARTLDIIGDAVSRTTNDSVAHDSRKRCGICNTLTYKYYTGPNLTGGKFRGTEYSILCNLCHKEWREEQEL